MLRSIWQDVRYAARSLRQRPLFALVAIVTLALGIGANTAIFSVVDAVMLRPLGYDHAGSLVSVVEVNPKTGADQQQFSFPNFRDLRARSTGLSQVAAFRYWLFNVSGDGKPESVLGIYAGDSLFTALHVHAAVGRLLLAGADQPSAPHDVVLSHGFWQRRYAGDASIVGRVISVDGAPATVVGVLPARFRFPALIPANAPMPSREPDVYLPVGGEATNHDERSNDNYWVIGRLAGGRSVATASTDLARVAHSLATDFPGNDRDLQIRAVPLKDAVLGDADRPLAVIFGAVSLVLLIACANVGGLMLARASERHREIGIRIALGASRVRVARQLLTESVLLALAGGGCGVLLASWGVQLLRVAAPATIPRIDEITVDARVLLFTLGISVVTGLLFGLAPVLQRGIYAPAGALRDGTRVSGSSSARRLRATLVVGEVALAVVLLTGAGLLLRSFAKISAVAPGFRTDNVMTMFTLLPAARYDADSAKRRYTRQLLQKIGEIPGVLEAGTVNTLPMSNLGDNNSVEVVGHPAATEADRPSVGYRTVSSNYFQAIGIPVAAGRAFTDADSEGAPPVAVVNQAFARRFFPGIDPVGQQIKIFSGSGTPRTIVGVAADTRGEALDVAPAPEVSVPYLQDSDVLLTLVLHTRGNPVTLLPAVRQAIAATDPDLAFYATRTMSDLLAASLQQRRFDLILLGGFASLALLLSALGLYGVIAFSVAQRTREMGIRSALGAGRSQIAALVVGEGALLGGIGLAIGLAGALAATRVLQSLLFEVQTTDLIALAGAVGSLAVVVLLASYLPARRAARIDPVEALRRE